MFNTERVTGGEALGQLKVSLASLSICSRQEEVCPLFLPATARDSMLHTYHMAGCLDDWLYGGLAGWMIGWLDDWLSGGLAGWMVGWLEDWLAG